MVEVMNEMERSGSETLLALIVYMAKCKGNVPNHWNMIKIKGKKLTISITREYLLSINSMTYGISMTEIVHH